MSPLMLKFFVLYAIMVAVIAHGLWYDATHL